MSEPTSNESLTALAKSKMAGTAYKWFFNAVAHVGPFAKLGGLVFKCGEFVCKHLGAMSVDIAKFCDEEAPSLIKLKPTDDPPAATPT